MNGHNNKMKARELFVKLLEALHCDCATNTILDESNSRYKAQKEIRHCRVKNKTSYCLIH